MDEPPRAWPFGTLDDWRAWRQHLDTITYAQRLDHLKREADIELARIARCAPAEPELARPALVPHVRVGENGAVIREPPLHRRYG